MARDCRFNIDRLDKLDGMKQNESCVCVCLSCTLLMSHPVIRLQDVPQGLMERLNKS